MVSISRIEVAVCADTEDESLDVVASIIRLYELDPDTDVLLEMVAAEDGEQALLAVLQVGINQSQLPLPEGGGLGSPAPTGPAGPNG